MSGAVSADVVVIGAGVVGLAVARALALAGREVIVVEAQAGVGLETSSRNSGVIHAGLYYRPGSLKARLCIEGGASLVNYCRVRGIEHSILGKLIVASGEDQVAKLVSIRKNAEASGVSNLLVLSKRQAKELEPHLECASALLSPSTGIVDVHDLMTHFQADLEDRGGLLVLAARMVGGSVTPRGLELTIHQKETFALSCRTVINSAGLAAQTVAAAIVGFENASIPRLWLAKGNYFSLRSGSPFRHLIYPVPSDGGLGIHLTLDLAGRARFGPDVQWVDTVDYSVDPGRLDVFETAIRTYWPELPHGALSPEYCGIRPKLHHTDQSASDFMIQSGWEFGAPGLVNLYGIESPGLTSCLAIGDYVVRLIEDYERRR